MYIRLTKAVPYLVALAMTLPAMKTYAADDAHTSWYAGIEGGAPFATSTFSSFGHDKTRAGWSAGIHGGYRFNAALSAELFSKYSSVATSARACCEASEYWLGSDGMMYHAPVLNMDGWNYSSLRSDISAQRYGVRLNVNLLGFAPQTRDSRWSIELSPMIAAAGTKATIKTIEGEETALKSDTRWHFAYGGDIRAAYRLTTNLSLGIYSGITSFCGQRIDGMPKHIHHSNFIWESGIRLGLSFGSSKKKAAADTAESSETGFAMRPVVTTECSEKQPEPAAEESAPATETPAADAADEGKNAVTIAADSDESSVSFPDVYFPFNRTDITPSEQAKMQQILNLLRANPEMKVTVNGWCDATGSVAVNDRISRQRAETVKLWLVSHGIDAVRITAAGNGIDHNETENSKARRVSTSSSRADDTTTKQ